MMGGGFGGSVLALFPPGAHAARGRGARRALRRGSNPPGHLIQHARMDRRLAYKNIRTGLIAGAIALVVFALSWVVGLVY